MKKKIINLLLYLLFPILFNLLFFMIGGAEHPASVWISYAWIHIAYLMMIATPLFSRKTQSNIIFQFTTGQISAIYFAIELITGLIFIFIGMGTVKVAIIVQTILLILYLFVLLWNLLGNEHTSDNEQRRAIEINFIKSASSKAKLIMDSVSEESLKKHLEKIYDLIHSSPSKSYPEAKVLENTVLDLLSNLSDEIDNMNYLEANRTIKKILFSMEERNRIIGLRN